MDAGCGDGASRCQAEGGLDAAPGDLVATDDALGVDLQQHLDTVASPGGDQGGVDAGVEPGGDGRVPEI
jgi:hypothetical protein